MKASSILASIRLPRGLAVLLAALFILTGCGRPPARPKGSNEHEAGPKGDPWQAAAKRLQKESDRITCKSVLDGLNAEVAKSDKADKPAGHSKDSLEAIAKLVPLNAEDRAEIEGAAFTAYDSVYLASCLFLRDAVRSLSSSGLPPEQLADLGFAWVCRQVYLNPWLLQTTNDIVPTALPPVQVLRRGNGTALERMYVFLALLQQAGLDGCLIGPARASEVTAYSANGTDGKPLKGGPARPFWAVGVRLGNDIRLYDPWRCEPFPAMWNKLKSDPDAYREWFDDRDNVTGVRPTDVRTASIYLAVPVNSLSLRMALLEQKLKDDVGVRLALAPAALRDSYAELKPEFWNPPEDRFAYGRAERTFLPPEEGGSDRTERSQGPLYYNFIRSLIPSDDGVIPQELRLNKVIVEDIVERIGQTAKVKYAFAFLNPPTPRERLQRGHFQDASLMLVDRQDEFGRSLLSVRHTKNAEQIMRDWAKQATEVYAGLGRGDPAARVAIDDHWRSPAASLLLDRAIGEVGQAETSYLLALCKHEQAERIQARLDRATPAEAAKLKPEAKSAWAAALREWRGYLGEYAKVQAAMTGRQAHARELAERAEELAIHK